MNSLFRPKIDASKFVIQELPDELLIYNLITNKVFALNQTSGFIWQHCTGKKTIKEITEDLEKHLHQHIPEELVWLALERLESEDLVILDESSIINEMRFNRRTILKAASLATLATLPLISTVVAPAAHGASSLPPVCTACINDLHSAADCPTDCDEAVVGDCHSNNGCGQGFIIPLAGFYTCTECAAIYNTGPGLNNISWHATGFKP